MRHSLIFFEAGSWLNVSPFSICLGFSAAWSGEMCACRSTYLILNWVKKFTVHMEFTRIFHILGRCRIRFHDVYTKHKALLYTTVNDLPKYLNITYLCTYLLMFVLENWFNPRENDFSIDLLSLCQLLTLKLALK